MQFNYVNYESSSDDPVDESSIGWSYMSHSMIQLKFQNLGIAVHILTMDDAADRRLDVPLNPASYYQGIRAAFLPRTFCTKEIIYSKALSIWHNQNLDRFDLVHTHYLFSCLPN